MYFNVHTHPKSHTDDVVFIENLYKQFEQDFTGRSVSMGLHPWFLDVQTLEEQLESVAKYASAREVLAIGECGLDKLCTTDWDLQIKAFQYQIKLAEELSKPLIIHCVKAFNEVLLLLKDVAVPVIFHGINNKLSLVQPVIDQGYYLSFGKSVLGFNEAILNTFRSVPLEKLFLETDDADLDIREIYKTAARVRNISKNEIVLQLERNFSNVFQR